METLRLVPTAGSSDGWGSHVFNGVVFFTKPVHCCEVRLKLSFITINSYLNLILILVGSLSNLGTEEPISIRRWLLQPGTGWPAA